MRYATVLREDNGLIGRPVEYSQDTGVKAAQELQRAGFRRFEYHWQHLPSKKSGRSPLWAYNLGDAQRLIDYWSGATSDKGLSDVWRYTLITVS